MPESNDVDNHLFTYICLSLYYLLKLKAKKSFIQNEENLNSLNSYLLTPPSSMITNVKLASAYKNVSTS